MPLLNNLPIFHENEFVQFGYAFEARDEEYEGGLRDDFLQYF